MQPRTVHVPERFERAVLVHVAKILLANRTSLRVPLILGIHGRPGVGKTFQCYHVLEREGVSINAVGASELESEHAGRPGELIRNRYLEASDSVRSGAAFSSALLINDIDTGVGDWGASVQYTVNRQNVFGALMSLTDDPWRLDGIDTVPVPIIVTGNDLSTLYGPLLRAGRMEIFEWSPTVAELTPSVWQLFPHLPDAEKVQLLITELSEKSRSLGVDDEMLPLAFFAHLRAVIENDRIWDLVKTQRIAGLRANLPLGFGIETPIPYDVLVAEGEALLRSRVIAPSSANGSSAGIPKTFHHLFTELRENLGAHVAPWARRLAQTLSHAPIPLASTVQQLFSNMETRHHADHHANVHQNHGPDGVPPTSGDLRSTRHPETLG